MKVSRLSLDEALFDGVDDSVEGIEDMDFYGSYSDIDDDFDDTELDSYMRKPNTVDNGPKSGEPNGIADELIRLINDEWEAIQGYNNAVELIRRNLSMSGDITLQRMIPVLDDIRNEENKHVGQLQELLRLISPNVKEISNGEAEGRNQIRFVDGKLPVQTFERERPKAQNDTTPTPNEIDTMCSLLDIDDEM